MINLKSLMKINISKNFKQVNYHKYILWGLLGFSLSFCSLVSPAQVKAADEISFYYDPFGEFNIQVDDLEILANEGRITKKLAFFTNRLTPKQLEQLEDLLSRQIKFNPVAIYKFTNSPIGEIVLQNIGTAIKSSVNRNGFLALRGAILAAAFDDQGLTLVNMLRKFPHETIHLDTDVVIHCIEDAAKFLQQKESIVASIKQQSQLESLAKVKEVSNYNPKQNLSIIGSYPWKKETLEFRNPERPTNSIFDLYLPQLNRSNSSKLPLIIISHGLGSNRQTFAYLGEHLASQGFAVAIPEHIGTNSEQFKEILSGLAKPPDASNLINRPLDIKYLLDTLEQKSTEQYDLDLQKVGIVGQSLGGYTALAAGGAEHNRTKLKQECAGNQHDNVFFDLSALIQCRANELPNRQHQLQDERIKAILAINPLSHKVFGKKGLEKIQVPTMILSGTNDLITPPVQEQIYPFTWLDSPNKYLVLVEKGTHFSFLAKGKGVLPIPAEFIGPNPELAFPALKALSTAFFQAYISDRSEYSDYLNTTYLNSLNSLNSKPFEFSVIRSLTETQLNIEQSTATK